MSGNSFVLGLVGSGIERSLTPAMQESEGIAQGLNLTYRRLDAKRLGFDADDLPELLRWARRFGFDGLNITHPFKQAVVPLLDQIAESARDLEAVNTVLFQDGHAIGHNTDWSGYCQAFRSALPEAVSDRVVLIGAGGAGLAVGYALLAQGADHLAIHDVDPLSADTARTRLAKRFGDDRVDTVRDLATALAEADGLVNATPIGMHGYHGLPLDADLVEAHHWVSDVVYFPLETELIALARGRGCRVLPGGGMAVGQAVGAFELFTGRTADQGRMARRFQELQS